MTLWESIQREIDEANRRALDIIKPSEQEIERGLRVHGEAIVFDFGPPGAPSSTPIGSPQGSISSTRRGVSGRPTLVHGGPPTGYRGITPLRSISGSTASRGYSDQEITKILGGNFLRVFEEVVG